MQVERGNQIGSMQIVRERLGFFFCRLNVLHADIFELMRGEWKNQISVIRVVILGLGV